MMFFFLFAGCLHLLFINLTESFHGVLPNRYRQPLHRLASTATTSPLTADAVNAYLVALGTKKEDTRITIKKQPTGSFTAIASMDIKKGECLISVPLGICLDTKKATERFGSIATRLRTGEYGMLALLLLSEKALGDSSKYETYINYLPEQAPGILSWSETQTQELVKSTTRNIQDQLDAIASDWTNVVSRLPSSVLPSTVLTMESFRWAMGIVKAKSLLLDGQQMLVPGMDLIDYDPLCTADPKTDSAGIFGGKIAKVIADRSYKAGEIVSISYGLKSSAECLEDHSFIPDIILEDSSCEITCTIDGTEKYPDDKIDILERSGYGRSRRFDLEADSSPGMDPSLLQFLRLKMLEGKDCFILEACFSDSVFFTMGQPFSKGNEIKVFQYLIDFCKKGLERMDGVSSAERDESILSTLPATSNPFDTPEACMARLRQQERAVLQSNLKVLEAELITINGPDNREYYQERRLRDLNLLRPLDESEIVLPGERGPVDDNY